MDSAIAGLLLAKYNKSADMGVKFTVDEDTTLASYHKANFRKTCNNHWQSD
ncbi:hypothetical protein P4S72_26125 [Vibrio sp. PP-XX7]